MNTVLKIIIGLVAAEHLYFMWLEMFAWTTRAKKVFKNFPEHLFEETKVLAANQGLYNGFLAAGLVWSLTISDAMWSRNVSIFFLACVLIAAIYGGITADKKILFVQGFLPVVAFILMLV